MNDLIKYYNILSKFSNHKFLVIRIVNWFRQIRRSLRDPPACLMAA